MHYVQRKEPEDGMVILAFYRAESRRRGRIRAWWIRLLAGLLFFHNPTFRTSLHSSGCSASVIVPDKFDFLYMSSVFSRRTNIFHSLAGTLSTKRKHLKVWDSWLEEIKTWRTYSMCNVADTDDLAPDPAWKGSFLLLWNTERISTMCDMLSGLVSYLSLIRLILEEWTQSQCGRACDERRF